MKCEQYTHWPEMQYPPRYPGWESYPPRADVLRQYNAACARRLNAFFKQVYGEDYSAKLLYPTPIQKWLEEVSAREYRFLPNGCAALAGGTEAK